MAIGGARGLPVDAFVVAAGFEDNVPAVAWQVDRLRGELEQPEAAILEGEDAAPIWSALAEFQASDIGLLAFVANLRPSKVARFVGGLDPSLWSSQSHAGNGIVRAHWLGPPELERVAAEVDRLRAVAVSDGGNLVLSRCPVEWKTRMRVWGEPRADWTLAERIKRAFDPAGAMNPGRFVGRI
jgi:glycolate oxidase FAD binding subunit